MKKYQIIYCDPPWSYKDKKGNDPKFAAITYKTMATKDIAELPVKNISDDNCILFLWVTMPLLPDSFEIFKRWSFKYKTCGFVWVKTKLSNPTNQFSFLPETCLDDDGRGIGHYTMSNVEICLIGTKGIFNRIENNVKQVIFSPRREHSRKPDETRERIIQLCGNLPRIELFARQKTEGWDVWGDEVESDIKL